jgi:SagB-type dehydrogenase family enzyme
MYSTQLLLVAYNIEKLQRAIYAYQPVSHSLCPYSEILPLDTFIVTRRYNQKEGVYDQIDNLNPSVLIICVNNFSRQCLKYGELSLLLALVDCGCMLQNISLLASSLSLHHCIWTGFKKSQTENTLNIDGIYRHVIMTSLLGGKK